MTESKAKAMTSAQVCDWFTDWCNSNGYQLTEDFVWKNSRTRYAATCPNGHSCTLLPYSVKGRGDGCEPCSYVNRGLRRKDSQAARVRFLAWTADNEFNLVDFQWKGAMVPHEAVCPRGHKCMVSPVGVHQGRGGCNACRGAAWDAFYVVRNPHIDNVKFGISSGDLRPRLRNHKSDGYTEVLRAFAGLPEGEALSLEQELRLILKCAGVAPVQGREYFPAAALNVILGFVDEWLT